MGKCIWHRDGKRWTPPAGWQAIYDAIVEYAGQADHLYTEVERVLSHNAINLADAICAALNPPNCTHPACPLKAGQCASAWGRTEPFTDCPLPSSDGPAAKAEESSEQPAAAPGVSILDRVARAISFSIGTISDQQAIEAAEDVLATPGLGEEFLEFKEALDEVRGLRAEYECLNGGGPGWAERNRAAWARVDELFAAEDEAAYDRQQESFYG